MAWVGRLQVGYRRRRLVVTLPPMLPLLRGLLPRRRHLIELAPERADLLKPGGDSLLRCTAGLLLRL